MSRARALSLAVLAALAAACGNGPTAGPGAQLRQPSSVAVFRGVTLDDPAIRPYLAVASPARNELAVVDAADDTPVLAPIQLRALAVPVPDRPALLASASLNDGGADLLVAVSAGDSALQVVRTWTAANAVVAEVPLSSDVVAMAALPSSPGGTARIAVALADRRLAVVAFQRDTGDGGIVLAGAPEEHGLAFRPLSLAVVPGDEAHVYAATAEEVAPGVFGVGEVDVSTPAEPWTVRPLDARGPTRLVAAALLKERKDDSAADDPTAFEGQADEPRVYAVLDESGCGLGRPVDCGIVTLDPASGGIPADWAGRMPYRAPIRFPGMALALAVAPPPLAPPDPDSTTYAGSFMRIFQATKVLATTAVGAVATDDGNVHFLDLGRFKLATGGSPLGSRGVTVPRQSPVDGQRLWLRKADGSFAADETEAAAAVSVTPGYTTDDAWAVTYQGVLPNLAERAAEAGLVAPGEPWLALQRGEGAPGGPRALSEVVRLYHPALAVRVGDLAVLLAKGIAGCEDSQDVTKTFDAEIGALLSPTPEYPGGAVTLVERPGFEACFAALETAIAAGGGLATRLTATIRAGALVLTSARLAYAGRPALDADFSLEYAPATDARDEDTLAALCPLADWDGSFPAPSTCTGACRDDCERLVLTRKARRFHHLAEDCGADPDGTCSNRWPGLVFPIVNGPVIGFRVDVEAEAAPAPPPRRDDRVRIETASGAGSLRARPATGSPIQPNGVVAFDRSPLTAADGYRFFVSYPADFVLDTTPSTSTVEARVIR